ncbi:hypothetical protein L3Q82_002750 [Scortum barcoo]|uniref:Uncharacterized protein n=1 Tax=Scortum barcoo TaxID=214431 RepID=A0ACB8VUG3_9TELE|nr:hypothetical protein L3Q82_002750 [Scortum barcoo]
MAWMKLPKCTEQSNQSSSKSSSHETSLEDLHRPQRIELLISHREGRLAPQRVKVIGDLVLWEGPLGKTVGGAHPDLFEDVEMATHTSETHFARSMRATAVKYQELTKEFKAETRTTAADREFIDWWKWDSIGAACEPKCGGCRCGNCQPGGKEMTLSEERELEILKKGLTYVKADAHSSEPHWDTKYPWIEDPSSLPNNRSGVEATFLRTEKQLKKEPEWRVAYGAQVHEMVERRAAKKLTREMIANWRGPVWYVSHLVAPNPHSVTTPVRLVWNSSQRFKGVSMNDLLLKGPDVLNPIRAVLLRFRRGVYAALGDIKKMYNSVWLEDLEMHLHRFLWRDAEDGDIEEYAITRVNIGDRPAGCIAQLAMRETAKLSMFTHLEEECRILEEDSYVDDILTSHNDLEKLDENTKRVEEILKVGGFFLKPWVRQLLKEEEENESGSKSPGRRGLVTPAKQKGAILVRRAFQEAGTSATRDTWDKPLSDKLREEAIQLFEDYTRLSQITFHRSLTPGNWIGKPWGVTFSDGSDQSYGAVVYFRWETTQGVEVRLVESKAKLTPLDQKGEPVKAETCGAVYAVRLRRYIEKHSRMEIGKWLHLLDSQTVLGAIQRDSYGYQTFFANRVGEIQKSTSVDDWWWISGDLNVADIITRGATPADLQENSVWQNGPEFLKQPVKEWPKKSAKEVTAYAKEGIDRLQRKSFSAALTRSQVKKNRGDVPSGAAIPSSPVVTVKDEKDHDVVQSSPEGNKPKSPVRRPPAGSAVRRLIDIKKYSSLSKLIRVIAWVWRAAMKWKMVLTKSSVTASSRPKWEEISSAEVKCRTKQAVLTVSEYEDAQRDLFLAAQEDAVFHDTTLNRLTVYKDKETGLLVCGGRYQIFNDEKTTVPILPYDSWLSTLLAQGAHNANHEEIAGTLLRMRKESLGGKRPKSGSEDC